MAHTFDAAVRRSLSSRPAWTVLWDTPHHPKINTQTVGLHLLPKNIHFTTVLKGCNFAVSTFNTACFSLLHRKVGYSSKTLKSPGLQGCKDWQPWQSTAIAPGAKRTQTRCWGPEPHSAHKTHAHLANSSTEGGWSGMDVLRVQPRPILSIHR